MGKYPSSEGDMAEKNGRVRRHYGKDQLKIVIAQVRFPMLHGFGDQQLGTIQEALRDRYPRSSREQQVAITIGPGGAVQGPGEQPLWRFTDKEGRWSVVISPEFAGIETARYTNFEDLCERFAEVLEAIGPIRVPLRERLGLRYVNEMRHPEAEKPRDWRNLLNKSLLGAIGDEFDDGVFHALQEIRLSIPPMASIIRHGYVGAEATQGEPFYLLDLDAFDENPADFDAASTMQQLNEFHEFIEDKWEMALDSPMRAHLGDEGPVA